MTFEEFFKKKRIDLAAFKQAEPVLAAEFEMHFEQMGEKSFDHTKKYWFNKLRQQYHLAPEIKTEKLKVENQLAEQTVTEELNEMADKPAAKVGFTPRFKAAAPAKPLEENELLPEGKTPSAEGEKPKGFTPRFKAGVTKPTEPAADESKPEAPTVEDKPKVGFTPRFKAGVTKPAENTSSEKPVEEQSAEEKPKVGFTPRFKAGVTKPAEAPADLKSEEATSSDPAASSTETPGQEKPKIGFTPRFKAGINKPAESLEETKNETASAAQEPPVETPSTEDKPKIGFTPRFKAGITKATATPTEAPEAVPLAEPQEKTTPAANEPIAEDNAAEQKPKIGFTPRFKAGVTRQTPPPAEE